MIVWGGAASGGTALNTGGMYNVARDSWRATPMNGAPQPRYGHAAALIGRAMVVWGGCGNTCLTYKNDGGVLDLQTGQWSPTSLNNAPAARCCMAYDGSNRALFVWGGQPGLYNTGGIYNNPATNQWITMTTQGAPSGREWTAGVWTGSQFVVWGGNGECDPGCNELDDGGRYVPDPNGRI